MWGTLEHGTRAADLRMLKEQKQLSKALCILAQVSDKLMEKQGMTDLLLPLTDVMALVVKTVQDLSTDRRVKIVSGPNVNKTYKKLAFSEVPVPGLLFGDDLKLPLTAIDNA